MLSIHETVSPGEHAFLVFIGVAVHREDLPGRGGVLADED